MNDKDSPNNFADSPSPDSTSSDTAPETPAPESNSSGSPSPSSALPTGDSPGCPRPATKNAGRMSARKFSRNELIAAIRECVAEVGRMPRRSELREWKGITQKMIERNFGSFREAFEAAGFEIRGAGYTLTKDQIFEDWARVVRKIGRIPTVVEFEMHNLKTGTKAYRTWFGSWTKVAKGMLEYAEERGLEGEWGDVLEITREYCRKELVTKMKAKAITESTEMPRINEEWPLYGAPLAAPCLPMIYAPRNEAGVLVLFGAMALKLGFMILWVGQAFPDVEAIREVQPGLWQRKRIEIEFQSRNFLDHGHDPDGCDLIVCWEDNWRESPVEIIELKRAVGSLQLAINENR